MRVRSLLAPALVLGLLLAGLPQAGRAAGSVTRATGRMTISGSTLSYTEIRLPSDARLSLDYYSEQRDSRPTPRFSAAEDFAGFVLVSNKERHKTWMAAQLPDSKGAAQRMISLGEDFCMLEKHCELPAGDYTLFLVTEAPITIKLQLDGIGGRSTLTPTLPATGELSPATESYFHSTPQAGVEVAAHGAGFSPTLDRKSHYLFSSFWFRGPQDPTGPPPTDSPALQIGNAGSCWYSGSPPAEAYAPGCPAGEMDGNFSSLRALTQFGFMQWGSIANLGPGDYGRGHYAVHTGIRDPGFIGFWFDLKPQS